MMTAESMLSKRLVLRSTADAFFLLKLFSSHVYIVFKALLVLDENAMGELALNPTSSVKI